MVTRWSQSMYSCATLGPVSTRMGDRLRANKPFPCVTSRPGQLSLAIPPWVSEMSTSESWGINRHGRAMHYPDIRGFAVCLVDS